MILLLPSNNVAAQRDCYHLRPNSEKWKQRPHLPQFPRRPHPNAAGVPLSSAGPRREARYTPGGPSPRWACHWRCLPEGGAGGSCWSCSEGTLAKKGTRARSCGPKRWWALPERRGSGASAECWYAGGCARLAERGGRLTEHRGWLPEGRGCLAKRSAGLGSGGGERRWGLRLGPEGRGLLGCLPEHDGALGRGNPWLSGWGKERGRGAAPKWLLERPLCCCACHAKGRASHPRHTEAHHWASCLRAQGLGPASSVSHCCSCCCQGFRGPGAWVGRRREGIKGRRAETKELLLLIHLRQSHTHRDSVTVRVDTVTGAQERLSKAPRNTFLASACLASIAKCCGAA